MKRSTLNLIMVLVGMNIVFGLNSIVDKHYYMSIIPFAAALIMYLIFKNEKNEQY